MTSYFLDSLSEFWFLETTIFLVLWIPATYAVCTHNLKFLTHSLPCCKCLAWNSTTIHTRNLRTNRWKVVRVKIVLLRLSFILIFREILYQGVECVIKSITWYIWATVFNLNAHFRVRMNFKFQLSFSVVSEPKHSKSLTKTNLVKEAQIQDFQRASKLDNFCEV